MFLLSFAAFASDSGIQRVYDREVECAYEVDPKPDPSTCHVRVRRTTPSDARPTWAIAVAPPGKLFVSYHMPDIDWGRVYMLKTPRAFDPVLLTVGLRPHDVCAGELVQYAHLVSERGSTTHQACAGPSWIGHGEVLLESHRKLPPNTWMPLWAHVPNDPERSGDVRRWFYVQIYISMDGTDPEPPPQHAYASVELLRASVPAPLPPRAPVVWVPDEPDEVAADGDAAAPE